MMQLTYWSAAGYIDVDARCEVSLLQYILMNRPFHDENESSNSFLTMFFKLMSQKRCTL